MKSSIGDGFFRSYKVSRCPNFLKGVRNCIKCYVSRHVTNTFLTQSSGTFFLAVLLRNAHQRAKIIPSKGGITMSDKGIIVIYNTESNGTKVEVKLIDGNLWLTQEQIEYFRAYQAYLGRRGTHSRGNCSEIPNSSKRRRTRS